MSNWPVICAAIAALFSAIATFLVYRLQKKVTLQSFAPLISLYDWQVDSTPLQRLGVIEVKKIKNYGHGPALRIHAFEKAQGVLLYLPRIERNTIQAVQPQEERDIAWQLSLQNASSKPLSPPEAAKIDHMNFQIVVSYSDINNRRYYTILDLSYIKGDCVSPFEKLAPGLILRKQKTIVRYNWFVHFRNNLNLLLCKLGSKSLTRGTLLHTKKRMRKSLRIRS